MAVTISGDFRVGSTLNAHATDTGYYPTYRWYADGVEIAGIATGFLTLTPDLVGKYIRAEHRYYDNHSDYPANVRIDSSVAYGPVTSDSAPPVIGHLDGDYGTYVEGQPYVLLDQAGNATFTDADTPLFGGGSMTISIVENGVASEDVLGVRHQGNGLGEFAVDGSSLFYSGGQIGTLTGGVAGQPLTIAFTSVAVDAATVQQLVRNLSYQNTSKSPAIDPRQIEVAVHDGEGGYSTPATVTIAIQALNDAPVLATPLADQHTSAGALFSYTVPAGAFTDVDAGTVLTYNATSSDGSPLPGWLNFDPASRTFSGIPDTIGTVQLRVIASDGSLSAYDDFSLDISSAPAVLSIVRTDAAPELTRDGMLSFTVTFTQPVSGVDKDDFWLVGSGSITVHGIESIQSNALGDVYTVIAHVSGDGMVGLDLAGLSSGIVNADGAPIPSTYISGQQYRLDQRAPATPGAPALDAASDTGASSSDAVTSDATPLLKGTAEANSTVRVHRDGTEIGTTHADPQGQWSYGIDNALADGPHTFTITATDAAGNVSAPSAALTVIVDTAAPSQSWLSGGLYTSTAPVLSGYAEAGSIVTVEVGGATFDVLANGEDGYGGQRAWTLDLTSAVPVHGELALADGLHPVAVTVTDAAGNAQPASSQTITINSTAPVISGFGPGDARTLVAGPASAVFIDSDGTPVSVSDAAGLAGGHVTVTITHGHAGDVLNLVAGDGIAIVPCNAGSSWISIDGHDHVAAYDPAGGDPDTPLVIRLKSGITPEMVAKLIGAIQFASDSATPGERTLSVTVGDGTWTSTAAATTVQVDVTPNVASVGLPLDGLYAPGDTLTFSLDFDQTVTVGGTPQLSLLIGTATVQAQYLSGSGTGTLVFAYTVQAGDRDADGIAVGTLSLNGGTISAGTAGAVLALPGIGSTAGIRVDGIAPDAPAMPVLDTGSDSGLQGDGITRDNTPTLAGTAEPGSSVVLYDTDGITVLGITLADAVTGAWSITSTPLLDGLHSLTVKATDAAGNVSQASAPLELRIDTAAPAAPGLPMLDASSDSGSQGDGITNDNTPTVSGTAEAGSIVVLYDSNGTTVLGTATADATTGAWSITSIELEDGMHSLTVKATDAAGNESPSSATLELLVDTAAPAGPDIPVLDLASDSGANGDGITNHATPTITGTAEAGSTVTLYDTDGATVLGSTTADAATGAWSIPSIELDDGTHSLTAKAADAAGNVSQASAPLELVIDAAAPSAPAMPELDAASDSGIPGDGITNDSTPTLVGTAEAGSTIVLYDSDGTTVLGTATADATTGAWSITSPELEDGTHSLTIKATDAAGNESQASAARELVIDTTAPSEPDAPVLDAASDSGIQGDDITSQATPTITGTAEVGSTITLYDTNGTTVLGTALADAVTGDWSITSAALADGLHSLTVTATDIAGNMSQASAALELVIDTAAPDAPGIPTLDAVSDSGIPGDGITNASTPTIVGTTEAGSTVTLYDTDGTTVLGTTIADALTGEWSIVSTPLADGTHSLTIKATDHAGNESAASAALALTIDTSAPGAPDQPALDAASDSGTQGDNITSQATPTITGTAEAGSAVTLYDTDGTTVLGTAIADAVTGAWSITSTALEDGTHGLAVRVTDIAGNVSQASASLELLIDTAAPSAPAISASANGVWWSLAVSGLEAGAAWEYRVGDADWQAGTGSAFVIPMGSYAKGSIQVRQIDAAGNTSASGSNAAGLAPSQPPVEPPVRPPIDEPGYDGNGDGIPDARQPNVRSAAWGQSPDEATHYLTLAGQDGMSLSDLTSLSVDAGQLPAGLSLPFGALAFTATGLPPSGVATFSLFIDSTLPINGYFKQIDGHWVNVADAIVQIGDQLRIDFTLADGGHFDADGARNGVIVDPGAPGWFAGNPDDLDVDQIPDRIELDVGTELGLKDNDVFARDDLFVMQVYRDALGREADAEGLAYWQDQLEAGLISREGLAHSFVTSAETERTIGDYVRLSLALDEHAPDIVELRQWREALAEGQSADERLDAIVLEHYGQAPDADFVAMLYEDVLDREADAGGRDYWMTELAAGQSRGDVALELLHSDEFDAAQGAYVQAALLYAALLGREPDAEGLAYWSEALTEGASQQELVHAFIATQEYHDRFLPTQEDWLG